MLDPMIEKFVGKQIIEKLKQGGSFVVATPEGNFIIGNRVWKYDNMKTGCIKMDGIHIQKRSDHFISLLFYMFKSPKDLKKINWNRSNEYWALQTFKNQNEIKKLRQKFYLQLLSAVKVNVEGIELSKDEMLKILGFVIPI